MANGSGATSKWYTGRIAVGVVCAVAGLAIGSANTQNPKDSQAYSKLETSYQHAKTSLASFKQHEESATSENDQRSALLDEQESELNALKEELDERETKLKAAEDEAKVQASDQAAGQSQKQAAKQTTKPSAKPAQQSSGGCTRTSSGSCIQGGQFCPKAKYGQTGRDASGRTYRCTGSSSRPHWM